MPWTADAPYALVLDTETTGLDAPDVIELARTQPLRFGEHENYLAPTVEVDRWKPTKPIEPGAMAVHRIIDADLDGCPTWPGRWEPDAPVGYLLGHNVDHDWRSLKEPPVKRIDTLAIAQHVYPELGSYKLTALIFYLYEPGAARDLTEKAHESDTDVRLTLLLLSHLLYDQPTALFDEPKPTSWEALWHLSEYCRIPLRIGFSKYGPKNGKPGTLYTEVPTGMLKWIVHPDRVLEMDPWEVKATVRELARRGVAVSVPVSR